jgi:hypothetical protein
LIIIIIYFHFNAAIEMYSKNNILYPTVLYRSINR